MAFNVGDPVLAVRPLGFLDRVPEGTFGVVQLVSVLGEHTVDFEDGRRLSGLWAGDLMKAAPRTPWSGPTNWWALKSSEREPTAAPTSGDGLGLRVLIALPVLAVLVYALQQVM